MNVDLLVEWHCNECRPFFLEYTGAFVSSFATGVKLATPFKNFSGRVIRGISKCDFISLADNQQRRVVFLLNNIALSSLIGLDGKGILRQIGYSENFIKTLLARKTRFKLVLLPESSVKIATWDNLLDMVKDAYPDWCEKITNARLELSNNSYEEVLSRGGIPADVRRFLFNVLNVNPLFAGDGYIRSESHPLIPGFPEFITLNKPLSDFSAYAIISFPVI